MTVATKLHHLASGYSFDTKMYGHEHGLVKAMMKSPCYVVSSEVVGMLLRTDVARTVQVLCDAGLARLPYPQLLVEFTMSNTSEFRDFVLLEEIRGQIRARCALLRVADNVAMMFNESLYIDVTPQGLDFVNLSKTAYGDDESKHVVSSVALGVSIALIMLNTKGIDKKVVEVHALNKHRVRKGKVAIPTHTVIHIGTVYRRDGTSEKHHGGWSMPMHLRQAYTRNQHYGPGNESVRPVFIPSCVVNYDPNVEMKTPRKRIEV